jgi:hypothetical protein
VGGVAGAALAAGAGAVLASVALEPQPTATAAQASAYGATIMIRFKPVLLVTPESASRTCLAAAVRCANHAVRSAVA